MYKLVEVNLGSNASEYESTILLRRSLASDFSYFSTTFAFCFPLSISAVTSFHMLGNLTHGDGNASRDSRIHGFTVHGSRFAKRFWPFARRDCRIEI